MFEEQVLDRHRATAKHRRIAELLAEFQAALPSAPAELHRDIKVMVEHIHDQVFSPTLNVANVKASCRLRNNNVATRFHCALGITIRGYIEHLRMQAAARLLEHDDIEIFRVSEAVGYSYHESFTRTFLRLFGCPPSRYRAERQRVARHASRQDEMIRAPIKTLVPMAV